MTTRKSGTAKATENTSASVENPEILGRNVAYTLNDQDAVNLAWFHGIARNAGDVLYGMAIAQEENGYRLALFVPNAATFVQVTSVNSDSGQGTFVTLG